MSDYNGINDNPSFPLKEAYQFLKGKGFEQEVNEIKESKDTFMSYYPSTLRRVKIIDLLEKNSLLNDFVYQYWQYAKTESGKLKIRYDKNIFNKFMGNTDSESVIDFFTLAKTGNIDRDKFISRFLEIFSESIARIYFSSPYSNYKDLGRPTIKKKNSSDRGSTLDFTLENKKTQKIYICEMKCELQFENYKYLELNDIRQIKHHIEHKEAFRRFLDLASNKGQYIVNVTKANKKNINIDGIILLWGKVTEEVEKMKIIKKEYKLFDVLSLEKMINEMI
jgi:hypothetical protein